MRVAKIIINQRKFQEILYWMKQYRKFSELKKWMYKAVLNEKIWSFPCKVFKMIVDIRSRESQDQIENSRLMTNSPKMMGKKS